MRIMQTILIMFTCLFLGAQVLGQDPILYLGDVQSGLACPTQAKELSFKYPTGVTPPNSITFKIISFKLFQKEGASLKTNF